MLHIFIFLSLLSLSQCSPSLALDHYTGTWILSPTCRAPTSCAHVATQGAPPTHQVSRSSEQFERKPHLQHPEIETSTENRERSSPSAPTQILLQAEVLPPRGYHQNSNNYFTPRMSFLLFVLSATCLGTSHQFCHISTKAHCCCQPVNVDLRRQNRCWPVPCWCPLQSRSPAAVHLIKESISTCKGTDTHCQKMTQAM